MLVINILDLLKLMSCDFRVLKEFKAFIFRGNVVDLAVGVIIGGAFGVITSATNEEIIMP